MTRGRTIRRNGALVFLIVLVALLSLRVHIIWDYDMTSTLLWNDKEALVFIARQRLGWSGNYLAFAAHVAGQLMRVPVALERLRVWQTVLIIDAQGVREHTLSEVFQPDTLFEDHLVGQFGDVPARWDGERPVPLTESERQRADRSAQFFEHDQAGQWRRRVKVLTGAEGVYKVRIGESEVEITFRRSAPHDKQVSVRLPGQPDRRVWSMDSRPAFVGGAEYERLKREIARTGHR